MSEKGKRAKKENAWQRFVGRCAERIEKQASEFEEIYLRYSGETDKERKEEYRIQYLKKIVPIFTLAFYAELVETSDREFNRMMSEVAKAMEERLDEMGEGYLNFELMKRNPLIVIQELFLTNRLGKLADKELRKHKDLFFKDEEQALRFVSRMMALMAMQNFSLTSALAELRPFFEVMDIGRKRLYIDENWATSVLALSLEEALVKKKLLEMGVSKSKLAGKFHTLLRETINLIEKKEKRRLSCEILLSTGYRNIRNKLVHEGHRWKPTKKETSQIVIHLLKLADELWELNSCQSQK